MCIYRHECELDRPRTSAKVVHAQLHVVEHAGDELSPYRVCFTDVNAPAIVAALLEIPEHHYFVAEDGSWIAVVTVEGDLDVVDRLMASGRRSGQGAIP